MVAKLGEQLTGVALRLGTHWTPMLGEGWRIQHGWGGKGKSPPWALFLRVAGSGVSVLLI